MGGRQEPQDGPPARLGTQGTMVRSPGILALKDPLNSKPAASEHCHWNLQAGPATYIGVRPCSPPPCQLPSDSHPAQVAGALQVLLGALSRQVARPTMDRHCHHASDSVASSTATDRNRAISELGSVWGPICQRAIASLVIGRCRCRFRSPRCLRLPPFVLIHRSRAT